MISNTCKTLLGLNNNNKIFKLIHFDNKTYLMLYSKSDSSQPT